MAPRRDGVPVIGKPRTSAWRLLLAAAVALVAFVAIASNARSSAWFNTCTSLLPANGGPGDVTDAWFPLEQQAIGQVEEMYGQTSGSDPSSLYALDYARPITRAFMFADLITAVQAQERTYAGQSNGATYTQSQEVLGLDAVVQYEQEWIAQDAINLYTSWANGTAASDSIANDVVQGVFSVIGLPWQNESDPTKDPQPSDFLNQAEQAFYGTPTTTQFSNGPQQNYPLGGAEDAQALHQAALAASFLNAVGQTNFLQPGGTTDPTLAAGAS